MSIAACVLVLQDTGHAQMNNQWTQAYAGYIAIAIAALVVALVVWIIIRGSARRKSGQ
jgi:hypothetical protein